jgi:hypothetical protein
MFLTGEQIKISVSELAKVPSFFGLSFLAFKQAGLTKGVTLKRSFTGIIDPILRRFWIANRLYFPFMAEGGNMQRWGYFATARDYQRVLPETPYYWNAFVHQEGSDEWRWAEDYIKQLAESRVGSWRGRPSAFHMSVWLFRDHNWPVNATPETVRDHLFSSYNIDQDEQAALFDLTIPQLAKPWLGNTILSEEELCAIIGCPPPPAPPPLAELVLHAIGPAPTLRYCPASRMNIIAGDNGLGKTFLLECLWFALTGTWLDEPALPRTDAAKSAPRIEFTLDRPKNSSASFTCRYDWDTQNWKQAARRKALESLVLYARWDGSFAIWDPARVMAPNSSTKAAQWILLQRDEVWNDKKTDVGNGRSQLVSNGLLRDWILWQTGGSRHKQQFNALTDCLRTLAPYENGNDNDVTLEPGEPMRVPGWGAQEIPTIKMPYGEVPIVHASAGMKRILSLAYMMVWTWYEHLANSTLIRREAQSQLTFLIDEVEAHLHPFWQRAIVPALMEAMAQLAPDVMPQLHIATHSPLVMASAETVFDIRTDALHHLKLDGQTVVLEQLPFVKRGRADLWLMSDVFGLRQPRSVQAEQAIEDAKALQLADEPAEDAVWQVHTRLLQTLAPDDDFWPRWRYFALQHGVPK